YQCCGATAISTPKTSKSRRMLYGLFDCVLKINKLTCLYNLQHPISLILISLKHDNNPERSYLSLTFIFYLTYLFLIHCTTKNEFHLQLQQWDVQTAKSPSRILSPTLPRSVPLRLRTALSDT